MGYIRTQQTLPGQTLAGVEMDASQTLLVDTADCAGITLACSLVDANASVTALTVTPSGSGHTDIGDVTWYPYPVTVSTSASGLANDQPLVRTWDPVSDGLVWQWSFSVLGNKAMRFVFAATGGASADLFTVTPTLVSV